MSNRTGFEAGTPNPSLRAKPRTQQTKVGHQRRPRHGSPGGAAMARGARDPPPPARAVRPFGLVRPGLKHLVVRLPRCVTFSESVGLGAPRGAHEVLVCLATKTLRVDSAIRGFGLLKQAKLAPADTFRHLFFFCCILYQMVTSDPGFKHPNVVPEEKRTPCHTVVTSSVMTYDAAFVVGCPDR